MEAFSFPFRQLFKEQLSEKEQELIAKAAEAAQQAYAPYSHFRVGAALLLQDGRLIQGANQENAAYPAGICAERAALAAIPRNEAHRILSIAVAYLPPAGQNNTKHAPLSPCGICRQSILEAQAFQQSPIAVYMTSPEGSVIVVPDASHLLPFHFGKEFL